MGKDFRKPKESYRSFFLNREDKVRFIGLGIRSGTGSKRTGLMIFVVVVVVGSYLSSRDVLILPMMLLLFVFVFFLVLYSTLATCLY